MPVPDTSKWIRQIINANEAIERALEYTGFEKSINYTSQKISETSQSLMLIDSTFPGPIDFRGDRIVWCVAFDEILLDSLPHDPPYPSNFEVLIDSETGALLKIQSNYVYPDSIFNDFAREDLNSVETETNKCNAIPQRGPVHTFLEILRPDAREQLMWARQYTAYYSICRIPLDSITREFWYLVFRGGENYRVPKTVTLRDRPRFGGAKDRRRSKTVPSREPPRFGGDGPLIISESFIPDDSSKTGFVRVLCRKW